MQYRSHQRTEPESAFVEYLEDADRLAQDMADSTAQTRMPAGEPFAIVLNPELERLRWFPLPGEGSGD